jgi:SAM-dependent methyltransferase
VISSLMIHHLRSEEKRAAFRDVKRLLRPGGGFHLLDFGPPHGAFERGVTVLFHHGDRLEDNLAGRLPVWLAEAGFEDVREVESRRTLFGRVSLYSARAPR